MYNPLGAVTAMQRGRLTSDGRTATFAPDESVVKTQVYDTLGRRVTNNDPDAGTYRYAYDGLDRLIATRDARGVINRYWYDRGGRLVAEDLGGEVAYEPGSWSTYGGASGTTCEIGYDYVPLASQTCFDVVYGFDGPYAPRSQAWESSIPTSVPSCASTSQGPLAGRPSWTRDRSGTVVLGYDCHGWAIWSVRQVFPDLTAGHLSLSTFDEAQRLLLETNPDGSAMSFAYSQRGMLRTAWFEEVGESAAMRLVDNATYDVQGRRISVEYPHPLCTDPYGFTCDPELVEPPDCTCDPDAYTTERLFFDARQRLSRKQATRSDGLVLLDFRYSYDSASNIVRIDDDRDWCLDREGPAGECPAEHAIEGYVPYDVAYDYDALYRLVRAEPIYKVPQPDRVGVQTWSFDALGSMETWTDEVGNFYGWSLGEITNGLQMAGDPGLGPLPENLSCAGGKMDILGRCVVDRDGAVAPHAIYEASIGVSGGVPSDDTLRAYYDAAGNMAAMVVHRPDACDLEDTTGGPDGEGCKEGPDFALFFAWDEVGNLIKVQRRSPVIVEDPNPPSGDCFEDENPEFFEVPSGSSFYWCVAATQASLYDFGNQRRVKLEAYEDGTPTGAPEGYSLYVSANYELRQAELAYDVYAAAITSRYARDGLATSWELDSAGPGYGGGGGDPNRGRYRVTLTNHLSSVGLVLDAGTGEPMRAYSQLPYGAEEKLVSTPWLVSKDVGRYEFTGKERDRTVGLVYFGARYLDGRLGRWVSVDPLAVHGGGPWDPFRYAAANPLAMVDPDGRNPADVMLFHASDGMTAGGQSIAAAFGSRISGLVQFVLANFNGDHPGSAGREHVGTPGCADLFAAAGFAVGQALGGAAVGAGVGRTIGSLVCDGRLPDPVDVAVDVGLGAVADLATPARAMRPGPSRTAPPEPEPSGAASGTRGAAAPVAVEDATRTSTRTSESARPAASQPVTPPPASTASSAAADARVVAEGPAAATTAAPPAAGPVSGVPRYYSSAPPVADTRLNTTPSPALTESPYSPAAVDARVRPTYLPNPAHDPSSPHFNPAKTPEPADAASVYSGSSRAGMGTWYGQGQSGWYRFSSDNAGGAHFSGTVPTQQIPITVRRGQQ